jgi:hypothetical protein
MDSIVTMLFSGFICHSLSCKWPSDLVVYTLVRGPFENFVDSPYYFKSELRGGAVTVSFSKYLPWQAMHFLQRSTHFSKTCCRPLITSKFFASELPFQGWKSPEVAWGEFWIEFCVLLGKSGSVEPTVQISPHAISGLFQPWKRSSKARNFEVINCLQHVSRIGWSVVRNASLSKGGTSKKRPSPHLHKVPTRSNKVSPRNFQTALLFQRRPESAATRI